MEISDSKHTFESNLRFSVILTRGNFAEPVRHDDRINQRVPLPDIVEEFENIEI